MKTKYEIRQLDAWGNYEDGFDINESWHLGYAETGAKNPCKALWRALHRLDIFFRHPHAVRMEWNGDWYEIIDRRSHTPLFAFIPQF